MIKFRPMITWQDVSGQQQNMQVDAFVREQHSLENTVTEYAVERGSNVSDHVRPNPIKLSLEGVISNAPNFEPLTHSNGARWVSTDVRSNTPGYGRRITVQGQPPSMGGAISTRGPAGLFNAIPIGPPQTLQAGLIVPDVLNIAVAQRFDRDFDRVQLCFDEFSRLRDSGTLLTIVTSLRRYENMAIESFNVNKDVEDSLKFSLNVKQVRFGTLKVVPLPKPPGIKAKGQVAATPVADDPGSSISYEGLKGTPLDPDGVLN